MTIKDALRDKQMTIYRLSKESEVPYATCNDIVNGKTSLEKCSAETVYKIANALSVSMENLIEPLLAKRSSFENFKSTICHRVKELGDIEFVINTLQSDDIRKYYNGGWYPESLYLLAMLDYLCRENSIPICEDYDDIRKVRLEKVVYPAGISLLATTTRDNGVFEKAEKNSIPEFRRFNIIESEVRNVI